MVAFKMYRLLVIAALLPRTHSVFRRPWTDCSMSRDHQPSPVGDAPPVISAELLLVSAALYRMARTVDAKVPCVWGLAAMRPQ